MNLFNGSLETTMLLWSIVLGLVQLFVTSGMATRDQGQAYNLSPRDQPAPPVRVVTARMQRAFKNFQETFPFFIAAIVFVTLAGRQDAMSALGAQLYFWGRLVYVPLYASGIVVVRTIVWAIATLGLVLVILAGFGIA